MSLETFTGWIKDLIGTNPAGGDPKSQGDDHIRGIKQTLLNQFAGLTTETPVTVTAEQLNQSAQVPDKVNRSGDTMTGQLNGTGFAVRKQAGTQGKISIESATSPRALLLLSEPEGADAVYAILVNDASQLFFLFSVGINQANGTPTSITLGSGGVPLFSGAVAPPALADDSQLATTSWARRNVANNVASTNAANVVINTGFVTVTQTSAFRTFGRVVIASAHFEIQGADATGTYTALLTFYRQSDAAVLAGFTVSFTHIVNQGQSVPISGFYAGGDESLFVNLVVQAPTAATILANKAVLVVHS